MKKEPKSSSGIPLLIIVIVLILVVGGGYWLYSSSKPAASTSNRAASTANTARTPQNPVNAPPGAQPPNMLGSPTALVTVEEFADFQCGSCAAAHPTLKEIQGIYGSRIKFIFRNYPLSIPAHDKAYDAAVAVEAAGMQGKFWQMQDQLFTNQQTWTANPNYRQLWADYAQKIGLDVTKFQNDMAGIAAKSRVDLDLARGRALSVSSTPTVYVNGTSVPYPEMNLKSLRQIIDAELQLTASQNWPSNANTGSAPANPNAPAANTK